MLIILISKSIQKEIITKQEAQRATYRAPEYHVPSF